MEHEDQWCLGLFLLELKRHREKLLKDNSTATQAHPQRKITTFFEDVVFVVHNVMVYETHRVG